jgi:hypothetical protein
LPGEDATGEDLDVRQSGVGEGLPGLGGAGARPADQDDVFVEVPA